MNELLKLAEFFFNHLMGQRKSIGTRSQQISIEILNQIRRVMILAVVTIGALVLFCMGMGHLIERILNNIDEGIYQFTPSVWVIAGFLVLCIAVMVYSTNKNVWIKMLKKDQDKNEAKEPQGLIGGHMESVISLLVLDIIKEREINRETRIKE